MADSLKVECPHCGGSLKLRDRSADGKKVRCPKCEETFRVELPADDVDDLDDLMDDFGDDELPEEEDEAPRRSKGSSKKPTKKKRKSSGSGFPWLIVAIAVLVMFALGGVVFVVANFSGGGGANKIDLAYLPPDVNMVMHLKVAEMIGSPLLSGVMNQPELQGVLDEQAKQSGVALKDMVSVTAGMVIDEGTAFKMPMGPRGFNRPATPSVRTVAVLRTSAPINAEALGKVMNGAPLTHSGKTYYKRQATGSPFQVDGDTICVVEPTVALMGNEADIKTAIDQGPRLIRRKEFDFINPNMTLLLAFAPKAIPDPNSPIESPATQPNLQALERAVNKTLRAGAFGMRISDKIDIEILAKCADGAGAGEMKTATDTLFADLKKQYEQSKLMLAFMPGGTELAPLADATVASLKAEQSANMLTATLSVPTGLKAIADKYSSNLATMMGTGGPPGPGVPGGLTPPGASGGIPAGFDPSQLPPGTLPAELPPGTIPPGTLPPGTLPPGTVPPGTLPPAGAAPTKP